MVGGDGGHQRGVTDVQDADPMADRHGTHAGCVRGDLGNHVGQRLSRGRVRRVLQARHRPSPVVVTHHAGESHHGACSSVGDQRLVFG